MLEYCNRFFMKNKNCYLVNDFSKDNSDIEKLFIDKKISKEFIGSNQ